MKENFVKIVFVVDESGSMTRTADEVISGFNKFIEEQKSIKEGDMNVSLYKFESKVTKVFSNKNIMDVEELTNKSYRPSGLTALNDAIGIAIDESGKELADMQEEDRPSKVIFVVMTDGAENASHEYESSKIREMIKHQEEKYSWSFIYLGSDLKDADEAKNLGFSKTAFHSKDDTRGVYKLMSSVASNYRSSTLDWLEAEREMGITLNSINTEYQEKTGVKVKNLDS